MRWSPEKRWAFDLLAPQGIYVAAPSGPVSVTVMKPSGDVAKRYGHNRGCWPVKVGMTRSWRDNVTPLIDKDPFIEIGVKARLWLPELTIAKGLLDEANLLLERAAEIAGYGALLHGYVDAGPHFNASRFLNHQVRLLGKRMGLTTWTEIGLSTFLDNTLAVAKGKGIEIMDRRGRKILASNRSFIKLCDRLVEQEELKQFGKATEESEHAEISDHGPHRPLHEGVG